MQAQTESIDAYKNNIAALRQYLQDGFAALKTSFTENHSISRLFRQHCKLIDHLLIDIWAQLQIDADCCLIAVGGYGRGELFPHSDIDLLILIPEQTEADSKLNRDIESLIGLMWDIGLHVGHSVRSLNECLDEAEKDITVQTNLLESRLLSGNETLYKNFWQKSQQQLVPAVFFNAKLKEQDQRHKKYNDTAYNLEPNLKESPGGLRDLHMIIWVAHSFKLLDSSHASTNSVWTVLARHQVISVQEARQIRHHEKKLQLLRVLLHFLSGRREDRLLFDFQNDLAGTMG